MSEMQALYSARQAILSGDKKAGRELLGQVLKADPLNETAWLWLSTVVDDPDKERECLNWVLRIKGWTWQQSD
jgi:hypothetical protein